jgi:cell wall-associated NlpC family hydrolase
VAKASAILAVSGGLVATVAAPSSAVPLSGVADGGHQVHVARHAAPAAAAHRAAAPVPAVARPAVAASVVSPQFGQVGFKGNKAPEPEPVEAAAPEVERTTTAPSRSTERESAAEREAAQQAEAEREAEQRAAAEREAAERAAEQKKAEEQAAAEQAAPAPSGVLAIAARYVGTPYVYGGSSPSGFDCSGFTQYVFGQAGISLSRTTTGQQAQATPVSDPQPGDLVFFGYPAHHVGIYAGGGMMYDSGRPGVPVQKRAIFYSSGAVTFGRV